MATWENVEAAGRRRLTLLSWLPTNNTQGDPRDGPAAGMQPYKQLSSNREQPRSSSKFRDLCFFVRKATRSTRYTWYATHKYTPGKGNTADAREDVRTGDTAKSPNVETARKNRCRKKGFRQ